LWDGSDKALVWFRGNYNTAQLFDEAPVGIVEHRSEVAGQMHYIDATNGNTFFTNGTAITTGSGLNQWHLQATGNGGTVYSSADSVTETASNLMTQVPLPTAGTYDLWVNFWGTASTNADWRIKAGLIATNMQTYRSQKCEQVQPATQDTALTLTSNSTNFLYQAYVGRVSVSNNLTATVYVGATAILTGGNGSTSGNNTVRTWYDGVSYAPVKPFQIQNIALSPDRSSATITWNSPLPQFALTIPSYTVQKKNTLVDAGWIMLTNGMPSAGYTTSFTDSTVNGTAFYRVTWP
jgi:hypothetical protein